MGGKKKYPIDYHELATIRNFEWLGPAVKRTDEKTSWQCTCGYIWGATYSNISQGKGCPSCGGRKKFLRRIELDKIKTRFAKQNRIPLLRITYTNFDSIETILTEWIKNVELSNKGGGEQISGIQIPLPFND